MPTLPSGITRSSGTLYDVLTIDLGIARSDVEVEITGDVISVIEITGELDVKLNEKDEPVIELDKATRITITPKKFTKLFFTNTAQAGKKATLYIGREASFVPEAQRVGSVGILDSADVRIDPAKEDGNLATLLARIQEVLPASDSVAAAANTAGLTVSLDTRNHPHVDIYYKLGAAGSIDIEVSTDGVTWRPYYSETFGAAAEDIYKIETGYRYVRIRSPTTGIDLEFEISAKG